MEKQAIAISNIVKGIARVARPGINLLELEKLAETLLKENQCYSYNKGYQPRWADYPYPSILCLGVNDTICHGIPYDYVLQKGDILSIDCGIRTRGKAGDCAITIPIGEISDEKKELLKVAKDTLYIGIELIKEGLNIGKIGAAQQKFAKSKGYVINEYAAGHGIGVKMHEPPTIPHIKTGHNAVLSEGQVICLEPMLTLKDSKGRISDDKWTVKTKDGNPSAFFESMIRVEKEGYTILTNHFKK